MRLARRHAVADEQVLSKVRSMLGLDELESLNVGAAPTPRVATPLSAS